MLDNGILVNMPTITTVDIDNIEISPYPKYKVEIYPQPKNISEFLKNSEMDVDNIISKENGVTVTMKQIGTGFMPYIPNDGVIYGSTIGV